MRKNGQTCSLLREYPRSLRKWAGIWIHRFWSSETLYIHTWPVFLDAKSLLSFKNTQVLSLDTLVPLQARPRFSSTVVVILTSTGVLCTSQKLSSLSVVQTPTSTSGVMVTGLFSGTTSPSRDFMATILLHPSSNATLCIPAKSFFKCDCITNGLVAWPRISSRSSSPMK